MKKYYIIGIIVLFIWIIVLLISLYIENHLKQQTPTTNNVHTLYQGTTKLQDANVVESSGQTDTYKTESLTVTIDNPTSKDLTVNTSSLILYDDAGDKYRPIDMATYTISANNDQTITLHFILNSSITSLKYNFFNEGEKVAKFN